MVLGSQVIEKRASILKGIMMENDLSHSIVWITDGHDMMPTRCAQRNLVKMKPTVLAPRAMRIGLFSAVRASVQMTRVYTTIYPGISGLRIGRARIVVMNAMENTFIAPAAELLDRVWSSMAKP